MRSADDTTPAWNPRELLLYFALAYGISLVLWLVILTGKSRSRFWLSIGTFGPSIAALTTHRLKLQAQRGPVDVLVIDRAEKTPIEN